MTQGLDGQEKWLSLSIAAKRLGVHPATLRRWADKGDIPCFVTPGGHRRFSSLEIARRTTADEGEATDEFVQQWIREALRLTQEEMAARQSPPWNQRIDAQTRDEHRQLAGQLMTLVCRYLRDEENESVILEETRRIGQAAASGARRAGLPLTSALHASVCLHESLLEAAAQPSGLCAQQGITQAQILRLNRLLNTLHVTITEVYNASPVDHLRRAQPSHR